MILSRACLSSTIVCLFAVVAQSIVQSAASQETSVDPRVVKELRERAEIPSEISDDVVALMVEGLEKNAAERLATKRQSESATASGVKGSVSTVARCAQGYVLLHDVMASASDVVTASETAVDCDTSGCRAVRVDAYREGDEPFDLTVKVQCSG